MSSNPRQQIESETREAMSNSKIDAKLRHVLDLVPVGEIYTYQIGFTARLSTSNAPKLIGEIGRINDIASVFTNLTNLREIVSRKDVINLQQS